jgi:hypothetical protein
MKVTERRLGIGVLGDELLSLVEAPSSLRYARGTLGVIIQNLQNSPTRVGHDVRAVQVVRKEVARA